MNEKRSGRRFEKGFLLFWHEMAWTAKKKRLRAAYGLF
jgi:hypothetical protein